MITTTQMYWIVSLTSIVNMLGFITTIMTTVAVVSAIACVINLIDCEPISKLAKRTCFYSTIFAFIFLVLTTLTPTTRQMAAIVVVPKIVNNEQLQTVGNTVYEIALEWMNAVRPKNSETK